MSEINFTCYLVVGASIVRTEHTAYLRGKPSVRVSKNKPSLSSREIAIALTLSLPVALFQRPDLTATIVVPEEKAPFEITPEVQHQIAEQIREQTGFTVRIEASAGEEEA